jgi:hypothetical protein
LSFNFVAIVFVEVLHLLARTQGFSLKLHFRFLKCTMYPFLYKCRPGRKSTRSIPTSPSSSPPSPSSVCR